MRKSHPGPNRAQPTERGTRALYYVPRPTPAWDPEIERRRRDLLEVLREERTPGSRRIYLEG